MPSETDNGNTPSVSSSITVPLFPTNMPSSLSFDTPSSVPSSVTMIDALPSISHTSTLHFSPTYVPSRNSDVSFNQPSPFSSNAPSFEPSQLKFNSGLVYSTVGLVSTLVVSICIFMRRQCQFLICNPNNKIYCV